MSLISTAEVEAVMATGLDGDALQGIIDREEAWLAEDPEFGIGALTGARTVTLWPGIGYDGTLTLPRTTGAATITENGTALAPSGFRLIGATLERTSGAWIQPIAITFTPDDEERVRRVLFALVQLAYTTSPYASESAEGQSYSRDSGRAIEPQRERLARSLRPGPSTWTVALRPSFAADRVST